MVYIKKFLAFILFLTVFVCCGVCAFTGNFASAASDGGSQLNVTQVTDVKASFIESINQDLLQRIDSFDMNQEVGVIIQLESDSLIDKYNAVSSEKTVSEFASTVGQNYINSLVENQNQFESELINKDLVKDIKYSYQTILNGVYVTTTYGNIEKIMNLPGVTRVMISDTYAVPQTLATENNVQVYETGIFDSSDVKYTGEGTIVAVLDTGCDYSHTAFTTYSVLNPLMSREDVGAKLSSMVSSQLTSGLETRDVYYSDKIPYGYDYADKDSDIMPYYSEHGTHVAGIIGGHDSVITGVAVNTQLAIMKVFSDYKEGADDGDILAALEDSVLLGVDAINMSLGTSCGFSREVDQEFKNELYDAIEEAGISLLCAASNDYSSAFGSDSGDTNKASNPDSATVGAPSTYSAALSVASISGVKEKYLLANGNQTVFFKQSYNQAAKEYDFYQMLGISGNTELTYEYVAVPGVGMAANYLGIDVKGKIALVKRGDISFEDKIIYATEAGAVACIIYNNVHGYITMTVGNNIKIPAVSISKDDGDILAAQGSGTLTFNASNAAGPFMSDFSSWGPTPSLEIKPEITAHGGNILSCVPGGGYEQLSGTSMACPNMCGLAVLIRQYVKEKFTDLSTVEVRDLVNQLAMSTATIALDKNGNPYSVRKQGAGLASLYNAVNTKAYLYVDGMNKTKLELGDDKARTGVYQASFNIRNISGDTLTYDLSSLVMTESLSTSDKDYVSEMAYMLNAATTFTVDGVELTDKKLTVGAYEDKVINVKIVLSDEDKDYMNESFKNGMYVEGFITLDGDIDLSIPFLAFYGDWQEAPIFDLDYYTVQSEAYNAAIDEDDKIKADYYATTPYGKYYYDYIIPLGAYLYDIDESIYDKIPASMDKAAISYYKDSISGLYGVFTGLLRGAKELRLQIINTATGEVVWEDIQYNCYKAHYSGGPRPYFAEVDLDMTDALFDNNTQYKVTMSAVLDFESTEGNISDSYEFSFYVDYEAPTITNAEFRQEYDKAEKKDRYYVDLTVSDNQFVQSVRPVVLYKNSETGKLTYSSLSHYATPVYQTVRNAQTKVEIEITDYLDLIYDSSISEGLCFFIDDYAMNSNIYRVSLPSLDDKAMTFESPTMDLEVGQTLDLTKEIKVTNPDALTDFFKNLKWMSTNEEVVKVYRGQIECLSEGTASVSAENTLTGKKITTVITVTNTGKEFDNHTIEKLKFTSYKTLFAFEGDNDYSRIGKTGSINYIDTGDKIEFYPSEKVQLSYLLEPWNLSGDYTLTWASSNERVATVDQDGVVTAIDEGTARITLKITINGKVSTLYAKITLNVKSPFIIENRVLEEYKGYGGEVVIPDDKGIMYIGAFAFCHYDLDNTIEIEDSSDFDLKKSPLGNNTVTKVVIPEGVEEIRKYAFYNCTALKEVVLPESCKKIFEYAFYGDTNLDTINLDNIIVISARAFYNCESLYSINTSKANTIGVEAFYNCKNIRSADLRELKRAGKNAFQNCVRLTTVLFGPWTKLADGIFANTKISEVTIYGNRIPDNAFENCYSLKKVVVEGDLVYLGNEAFKKCTSLTEIQFKGGVEYIGSQVFYGCSQLNQLVLPSSEIEINDYAFAYCGIKTLVFSENTYLSNVGMGILADTNNLTTFDTTNSNFYKVVNNVVYSKDGKSLVVVLPSATDETVNVLSSVEVIEDGAFSYNKNVKNVVFANDSKLKVIGDNAFAGCTSLVSVTLPTNKITIGAYAFGNATSLNNIDLSNVEEIGAYAFYQTALTDVVIGSGANVSNAAFYKTTKLTNVTLGKNVVLGESVFQSSAVQTVNMPSDGSVTFGNAAFYGCTKLTTIDLSNVKGNISRNCFYYCTSLTSVDLSNVVEIEDYAFADCTKLASVTLGKVEKIGESAFAAYASGSTGAVFTTIVLPDTLKEIGTDAFYGCSSLTSIDLNNVSKLGQQAFGYCTSLATVVIGDNLKELDNLTFYGCSSLTSIDLNNVEVVREGALTATSVSQITANNLKEVATRGFYGLDKLQRLDAQNLKVLGSYAFYGCTSLVALNAPNLVEVGELALYGPIMQELEISSSLTNVAYTAFVGCIKLQNFYTYENGTKTYTADLGNVVLDDGILYLRAKNEGLVLTSYPQAKTSKVLNVLEGTYKIDYYAAGYNTSLEEIVLPTTLKQIGNLAFYKCTNLKKVTFNSFYAPTLEGTMTISVVPKEDTFTKFDELYKYDYYYATSGQVIFVFSYQNFKDTVGSKEAVGMTYVYPENSSGYDSLIYSVYFDKTFDGENQVFSNVLDGKYARDFINAMLNVTKVVKTSSIDDILNLQTYYNALLAHKEELQFVSQDLIDTYNYLVETAKVSKVENLINHIFDLTFNEYSYNTVKDAYISYNTLSESEKLKVSNYDKLSTKVSELAKEMNSDIDFSKNFNQYVANNEDPVDPVGPSEGGCKGCKGVGTMSLVYVSLAIGLILVVNIKRRKQKEN